MSIGKISKGVVSLSVQYHTVISYSGVYVDRLTRTNNTTPIQPQRLSLLYMNDGFLSLYSIINDCDPIQTSSFNFSLFQHVLCSENKLKNKPWLDCFGCVRPDERDLSYSCTYLYHKSCKNPILRTRVKIEQYLPRQQRHLTIISFPH